MVTEQLSANTRQTAYTKWIETEGVPSYGGYGIEDVSKLGVEPWRRMGCLGAYIDLIGSEETSGAYLLEIQPSGETSPEKHIYEEILFCVSGQASVRYWWEDIGEASFECGPGAIFASPLNTWHRIVNESMSEAARFLAITSAPATFSLLGDPGPIYDNEYSFYDRFDPGNDFFSRPARIVTIRGRETVTTNLISDIQTFALKEEGTPGESSRQRKLSLANNRGNVFVGEYPGRRYSLAHHHEPGIHVYIPRGEGFTSMWPKEAGIRPYQDGNADQVVHFSFRAGSIYVPPRGWFHNHYNVNDAPYLYVGVGPPGDNVPRIGKFPLDSVSITHGGTQIDRVLEDPEFRRIFERAAPDGP